MRQKRITELFPKAGAGTVAATFSISPFTKLPPNVRQTIYALAGLEQNTTEAFIDLNCWGYQQPTTPLQDGYSAKTESEDLARLRANWKSRIPVNLLLVSRAIHDEVEEALYRSPILGVSASGPGGLDVLENLSPKAMKAMRCLLISLTPCGCAECFLTRVCTHPVSVDVRLELGTYGREGGFDCSSASWEDKEAYRSERPLDSRSRIDNGTVAQWDRICSKLAHHVEPRLLSLYVHCVVKDFKMAELVVKPLHRLKLLNDLGVSFGQRKTLPASHDEQLVSLAKATVRAATYRPRFPFFDLPTELQLHVLSFTHLIRDEFDLMYIDKGWVLSRRNDNGSDEERIQPSRVDGHFAWVLAKTFCAESNIAFRDRCGCNRVPTSYFLVNKRFRGLALELFYGRNRIVAMFNDIRWCTVVGTRGHHSWTAPPLTHVLQHITRLALIAPIRWKVGVTIGFTHLLDLLRAHARLPLLTLELHVRDAHERDEVVAALHGVPGIPGSARRRRRHAEIYRIIVRQVRKKLAGGGLKAFLLYLWWANFDPRLAGDDVKERRELEREKEIESMGKGYDSEKWGKELQRKAYPRSSLWMYY